MARIKHCVAKSPPIMGYLHHAYLLSIAMNYPDLIPWYYSNYIQLYYFATSTNKIDFYVNFSIFEKCPFLTYEYIDKETVINNDYISIINSYLSNGYYLCTHLDEFYIPGKGSYKKSTFNHECLIYGCDDENKG